MIKQIVFQLLSGTFMFIYVFCYEPIQFLGPAENGAYAYGCRLEQFSGRNRSGSNRFGSGNTSSFRCRAVVRISAVDPRGIV